MKNRVRWTLAADVSVAVSLVITAACGEGQPRDPVAEARARAVVSAVDEVIVEAADAFAMSAERLEADVASFCDRAQRAEVWDVDRLRIRWRDLVTDWNLLSPFYFGPLDDDPRLPTMIFIESMRQQGTDHTTTVRELLDDVTTGTAVLDDAFFDALTFDQVGVLALEVLLFDSRYSRDVAADFRAHPPRCVLLENLAGRMTVRAEGVRRGWTESFDPAGTPYRAQFMAGDTKRGAEPLATLLAAVSDHFDYVRRHKLEGTSHSDLSEHLNRGVQASLLATRGLFDPPGGSAGLAEALDAVGAEDLTWDIRIQIGNGIGAVRLEDRAQLTDAVGELSRLFRDELPQALGVELDVPIRE